MKTRILTWLLATAGLATAQEGAIQDKLREQAAEVARLMRESERMLLEITRVERIVETQDKIVDELRKLLPPEQPPEGGAAGEEADEQARKRQQLEARQAELTRQLEQMLEGQKQSADMTVKQLEELLRSLPRQQSQGHGEGEKRPQESREERERRLREQREQQKQKQPTSPREKEDQQKDPTQRGERPPPQDTQAARMRRIEAWIARLPPEEQERINRNDFSHIPLRYRRLVEEYTAQRAKREAEKETEGDR